MKRVLNLLAISLITFSAQGQLEYGFKPSEARDMIALCNSFTYLDLYDNDQEIIPEGYSKEYTSGTFGMDNKFQVYRKNDLVVINLRGSTDKMMSWMENIYSAMIPAQGTITMLGNAFKYEFAKDTAAAVHAGYALGIAYMHESLVMQIKYFNALGVNNFILTGHSQGGALAIMLRAYLENLPQGTLPPNIHYKNYVFANPMVGNQEFATEYNSRFAATNSSFCIVNPEDPIPKLPITYSEGKFLSPENITNLLNGEQVDPKSMLMNLFMHKYHQTVSGYVHGISQSLTNQITRELGSVEIPSYKQDINYKKVNAIMEIEPFEYPLILRDSSILENDSLMAIYKRDEKGIFYDKRLYQKEPSFFQHKPHNYYVAILKRYFPEEYALLPKKILDENL